MNSTSLSTEDARSVSGISTRMPNDRVSWITAWPMSRMLTPPWASTPVMAAVRPGRSSPVILIRTISRKAQLPWQRRQAFYNSRRATGGCTDTCHEARWQSVAIRQLCSTDLLPPVCLPYTARHFPLRVEPRSVNRPATVKPDNFFLLIYRALRQRRIPLALRVVSHTLLLVTLALLIHAWVMGIQYKNAMQQQADALGQSLIMQTAASATDLLAANDILSLNVLLSNLVKNPLVAHAAIYSVDNRVMAESGSRPQRNLLGNEEGLYSTPISFQEVIAGHLRISLDLQKLRQPMTISLQTMG